MTLWKNKTEDEKKEFTVSVMTDILFLLPFRAWILMLAFGVIHNDVSSDVPPLGYLACTVLAYMVLALRGLIRRPPGGTKES